MRQFLEFFVVVVMFCLVVLATKVEENKKDTQIQVRAVFLNCDPDEKQSTLPDNEMTRFDHEELFKHSALRDCSKKLGVSVKLTCDANDDSGDVYIPIDHVLYGPKRKRIRLLNPYVLRFRWEAPLQAYELQKIDTVNGVLTSSEDPELNEKRKVDRHRRELKHAYRNNDKEKNPTLKIKNKLDGIDKDLIRSKHQDHFNDESQSEYYFGNKQFSNSTNKIKRNKRLEDNIVIEQGINLDTNQPRSNTNKYYKEIERNREISGAYDDTARGGTTDNGYEQTYYEHDNPKYMLSPKYGQSINYNGDKSQIEAYRALYKKPDLMVDEYKINNEGSKPDADINRGALERGTTNTFYEDITINENQNVFQKPFATDEKSYVLYEIGDPDLLQIVRVQMYEKLSNPDGNIVWNDVIKGEKASVSSFSPNWGSQDVNIRYQPAEWVSPEEFLLPSTSLCLLTSTKKSDTEASSNSGLAPDGNEYIVVPFDDIVGLEDDNGKRDINSIESLTITSNWKRQQGRRRVKIRTTRALFGSTDMNLSLLLQGAKQYLTLPHRRAHRAQIDLETRADENQLVCIGQFGRITTAVSDSTRRSRTTLTLQATNTGLASSRYKVIIRDCGPVLSDLFNDQNISEIATDPLIIPPKHTRHLELEIPTELPVDVAHCSVALLNDDNEPVALRDVTIKKGDRCFCVWHCDCVCLGEDPKLICREMPESRQIVAGLTLRDRTRRARSVRYDDSDTVNIFVAIFGMLVTLLILGSLKAFLGLSCACVRAWGLTRMFKAPPKLDRYYESSLNSRPVEYDTEGWPVHPDTKRRTVHLCSGQMEFMLNVIFFLVIPWVIICDSIKEIKMLFKGLGQPNTEKPQSNYSKKCFSSHDMQSMEALRSCRQRKGGLRRWMSPQAEKLSTDIWETALTHREPIQCEFMRPLLHGDRYRDVDAKLAAQDTYLDSEQDDTEYVLMQMQKSKELLTKSQRKCNDGH